MTEKEEQIEKRDERVVTLFRLVGYVGLGFFIADRFKLPWYESAAVVFGLIELFRALRGKAGKRRMSDALFDRGALSISELHVLLRRLDEEGSEGLDLSPGDPLAAEAAAEIRALRRIAPSHIEPAHVDNVLKAASAVYSRWSAVFDPDAKLAADDLLTEAFRRLGEVLAAWRGSPPCEYCRAHRLEVCGPHPRKEGDFLVGDIVRPYHEPTGELGRVREIFPWRMGGGASLIVDWLEGPNTSPTRKGSYGSSVTTAGLLALVERPAVRNDESGEGKAEVDG